MGVWTEDEFVTRAKTLAKAYVGTKTPLNDLVEKVAREAELTPDSIRTLGRLTNVAVFQEVFQQKAAASDPDRMVEFEPGDPEVVIQRVVKSAAVQAAAAEEKVAGLRELPDMMRELRTPYEVSEKVASEEAAPVERSAPRQLEIMRLRKMADELDVTAKMTSDRWETGVSKLAAVFRKAPGYGPSYQEFEKAALAELGASAVPELNTVREELRLPPLTISAEKIASYADHHASADTAELRACGELIRTREQYQIMRVAQAQVKSRLGT